MSAKRKLWRAQWQKPTYLALGGCEEASAAQDCHLLERRVATLREVELADAPRDQHQRAAADLSIAAQLYGAAGARADAAISEPSLQKARVADMQGLLRLAGYLQTGAREDRVAALQQLSRVAREGRSSGALRRLLDDSSLMEPDPELKGKILALRKSLGD